MKSLLLRLFQSDFFDVWIAVSYLFKYRDVGIQEYLCNRLGDFPIEDIQFFLPQLCHLLVTKTQNCVSLEHFLLELCRIHPHIGLLTFWYLENYNSDYRHNAKTIRLTERVNRLIKRFEATILNQDLLSEGNLGGIREDPSLGKFVLIPSNISSYIIGMGCVASSFVSSNIFGNIQNLISKQNQLYSNPLIDNDTDGRDKNSSSFELISADPPSLEELFRGRAFSFQRYINKNIKSHFLKEESHSPLKVDAQKSPSNSTNSRAHYQSERYFIQSLIDISYRLARIPKESRQKALQAEINLLNHNLPANVCLPLWCNKNAEGGSVYHDMVVRISPSDVFILNSAERVPYLIMVEILESESDHSLQNIINDINEKKTNQRTNCIKRRSLSRLEQNGSFISDSLVTGTRKDDISDISCENRVQDVQTSGKPNNSPTCNPLENSEDGCLKRKEYGNDEHSENMESSFLLEEFSERMRTAAILLTQLQEISNRIQPNSIGSCGISGHSNIKNISSSSIVNSIRSKIIKEMENLESRKLSYISNIISEHKDDNSEIDNTKSEGNELRDIMGNDNVFSDTKLKILSNEEDLTSLMFNEGWASKEERIKKSSPFGNKKNWKLISVIIKSNSDLRQEQLALQIIKTITTIWEHASIAAWLRFYKILVISDSSGIIETIRDTISLHSIRKNAYIKFLKESNMQDTKNFSYTLFDHFITTFGPVDSEGFAKAQTNFLNSLVGYSIVTYILSLKDRHNGNILIDAEGHLVHIDFGFMLSNSPGGPYVGFETAPFKLTQEYIDILGGFQSELFSEFKRKFFQAFMEIRKHHDRIILIVEMMLKDSKLACFCSGETTIHNMRERFQLHMTDVQIKEYIERLITSSSLNMFTKLYDTFQYYANGIL